MPNDFFKHNDKVYAENLNDGILVGNSFNFSIDIELPADTGGVFPSATTTVKAKVADVTPSANSNLNIGESITNNSGSNQDYRLTVYPNFNRFGGFGYIIPVGEGCSVKICEKGENTEIVNSLDYDDLSNIAQLKILKEYDIVITIENGGTLTGLDFCFLSKEKDISATINIDDINGLNSRLTNITNKNTEQDSRLSTLEATDAQFYNYELTASNYNPNIDDEVTITCKCTDINGNPKSNKGLRLYDNGVFVANSDTNINGMAFWTISFNDWDNHHIVVENASLDLQATGYMLMANTSYSGSYYIVRDKTTATLVLAGWECRACNTSDWVRFGGDNYVSDCRPLQFVIGLANNNNVVFRINYNSGEIMYRALKTNQSASQLYGAISWQIRKEDL